MGFPHAGGRCGRLVPKQRAHDRQAMTATTAPNVDNDSVNYLSEKNVHNNEIDSTDAIECSSKYDSSNVDKRDNGGEKRQSCETKFNSPRTQNR